MCVLRGGGDEGVGVEVVGALRGWVLRGGVGEGVGVAGVGVLRWCGC